MGSTSPVGTDGAGRLTNRRPHGQRRRAADAGQRGSTIYRLGIDVGGTFTDVALLDGSTGALFTHKVPSDPDDPAAGIVRAVTEGLQEFGVAPREIGFVAHGTTVSTNAMLERRGARTALITTRGFRDLLEIARQKRPSLYDLQADKPAPLVPRDLRLEVDERLGPSGVLRPLDPAEADSVVGTLINDEIESLAICLLYSFVDPRHELMLVEAARRLLPGVFVTASHQVSPEFREYERLSTTVANAYLGPIVGGYAQRFRDGLREMGISAEPYVNQSNGGVISVDRASSQPVRTVLSGPSAGVMGAVWAGRQVSQDSLITLDMGGTSCDVAIIEAGEPRRTSEREVAGLPLRIPSLDIHTVGAGGGSIAWVDSGGALKVGPTSAGANPGPACYGRGGTEATVTDANVVLGRLSARHLLGGRMDVDVDAAHRAIDRLGARLNLSRVEAARGVVAVVDGNMAAAVRVVSVRRGYDPRDFTLAAFGGAGPLHACAVATDLGIPAVLLPRNPGILCAIGLLTEELRSDFVRSEISEFASLKPSQLRRRFEPLQDAAKAWLEAEHVPLAAQEIIKSIDMRYRGQNHELTIPVVGRGGISVGALRKAFLDAHERAFGYAMEDEPMQIVNLRVTALGAATEPPTGSVDSRRRALLSNHRRGGTRDLREVYLEEAAEFVRCEIFARDDLEPGQGVIGPAIVEQMDATALIAPRWEAVVQASGNMLVTRRT